MADLNKVITLSVNTGDSNEYVKALVDHFVRLDKEINNANKSAKSLNDTFIVSNKYRKRTEATILREINAIKLNRKAYAETTIQYAQFTDQIQLLEIELGQLRGKIDSSGNAVKNMRNNAGLASQTLVEMGRTISDSNYGFTAMANNLSQLGYYMTTLVAESGGFKNTLKSLGRQLMGAGGVVIALQLVIAAFEKYTLKQREAKKEANEYAESMASAEGAIMKLQMYQNILNDTSASEDEHKAALQALKKDGYDPLTQSLDKYLDARFRVLRFNALEQLAQSKIQETLEEEFKIRDEMAKATAELPQKLKEAQPVQFYTGPITDADFIQTKENAEKLVKVYYDTTQLESNKRLEELKKKREDQASIIQEMFKNASDAFNYLSKGEGEDKKNYYKDIDERIKAAMKSVKAERDLVFERRKLKFLEQGDMEGFYNYAIAFYKSLSESEAFSEEERLEFREKYIGFRDKLNKYEIDTEAQKQKELERLRKEAEDKRKKELSDIQDALKAFAQTISSIGSVLDAEYKRQITTEKNKTNEINNELKERLRNESLSMEQRKNIQNQIAQNDEKLRLKQQEIEKKKFKANKAVQMSNAIVNTAAAAVSTLKDTEGGSIARIAGMIAVIGAGLAQVAIISKQKFQTSAAAMTGGVTNVDTGDSGQAIASPSFNVVGQSGSNQLARAVSGQLSKPVKAYVVSKDVSTSQEMDRNVVKTASLG